MKTVLQALLFLSFLSCNTSNNNANETSAKSNYKNISEERKTVDASAVKIYHETVKNTNTTDEFDVALYETNRTFSYLIKISYKNLNVEDTLHVPNIGMAPEVEIKTGDKHPSCIVGFLDKDKQFKESKLIYFEDNQLKIDVLKHYAVYADTTK